MAEREILFRGKLKDKDEWIGEWIEGIYCPCSWDLYMRRVEKPRIIILSNKGKTDGLWREVIPETVGQYTGLTDKNGVRIFEGDIVKTHYANAQKSDFIEQVVFHNGKFCAYFSNQFCKQWANLYDGTEHLAQDKSVYMDSVEVIGNIHDNPDILKGGGENG